MNEFIIKEIATSLSITEKQVNTVLSLLSEGNTIPFIARYRKEATGALDEEAIRKIGEVYEYQENLLKRKEDVIRLIDEKGLLTNELRESIMKCEKLVEVEDLYRPYKEKKKTKATEAIALGLELLAKMMMTFPTTGDIDNLCSKFINDKVPSTDKAVEGACFIIAEWVSDNAYYRKWIRGFFYRNGVLDKKELEETKGYIFSTKLKTEAVEGVARTTHDILKLNAIFAGEHELNNHDDGFIIRDAKRKIARAIGIDENISNNALRVLFGPDEKNQQLSLLSQEELNYEHDNKILKDMKLREYNAFLVNNRDRLVEVFSKISQD